jgi:thioesterase domain-containing protein
LLGAFHPERPIYSLQDPGIIQDRPLPESVEAIADEYITSIRTIQPKGPYLLMGKSFGGILAHTVAFRLQEQEEQIALVAILDAHPGDKDLDMSGIARDSIRSREAEMRRNMIEDFPSYPIEIERILRLAWHCSVLGATFQPHILRGDVLLFSATKRRKAQSTDKLTPVEIWKPYVTGRILLHPVECTHHEMTELPHIEQIGNIMNRYLMEQQNSRLAFC